jgi:hypothetical protein
MAEKIKNKSILLLIFTGMMEVTWLYAASCLLFLMLEVPLFPIWTAVLALFTPIFITNILQGRGRRIIDYVILHTIFYVLILLYTLYYYEHYQESFLSFQWIGRMLHQQSGALEVFIYILIIFWFSVLWYNGYKIAHRTNDHLTITSRFDLGIAALTFIFIILGSAKISFPNSGILIIYYFLFSMFAISVAKNLENSRTDTSYSFSRNSIIITFIIVVLLFGSWIVLFFLPQVTSVAQSGYRVLKIIGRPLGALFLKIISFLFGFGKSAVNVGPASQPGNQEIPLIKNSEPSWLEQLLQWLISWGFIIFLGIVVIIAIGWLLWSLWKWFSTKTELDSDKKSILEEIGLWLQYIYSSIKKTLSKIINNIAKFQKQKENITILFLKLCRWGHSSGIPRKKSHTPQEYGRKLSHFFPDNQSDIKLIIESFNQEIYGNKTLQSEQLKKINKAWHNLSSPIKWPLRLKVKILYSKKYNSQETGSYMA